MLHWGIDHNGFFSLAELYLHLLSFETEEFSFGKKTGSAEVCTWKLF